MTEEGVMDDRDSLEEGFEWTKEKLTLLIELYSKEDVLWDTQSPNYHARELRQEANERIVQELKCDVTVEEVIRKLRHLRIYYSRELAKVKRTELTAEPYASRWPFFEPFDAILRDHTHVRATSNPVVDDNKMDNDIKPDGADNDESCQLDAVHLLSAAPTDETHNTPKKKRARRSRPSEEKPSKRKNSTKNNTKRPRRQKRSSLDVDDDEQFGQSVANELKLIGNQRAKQFAKLQIHSILFNAQFDLMPIPRSVSGSLSSKV